MSLALLNMYIYKIPIIELYDNYDVWVCLLYNYIHKLVSCKKKSLENSCFMGLVKGTGTRDLIWRKVVSLDRSWLVGLPDEHEKFFKCCFIFFINF